MTGRSVVRGLKFSKFVLHNLGNSSEKPRFSPRPTKFFNGKQRQTIQVPKICKKCAVAGSKSGVFWKFPQNQICETLGSGKLHWDGFFGEDPRREKCGKPARHTGGDIKMRCCQASNSRGELGTKMFLGPEMWAKNQKIVHNSLSVVLAGKVNTNFFGRRGRPDPAACPEFPSCMWFWGFFAIFPNQVLAFCSKTVAGRMLENFAMNAAPLQEFFG